jgi:hypothetical protein
MVALSGLLVRPAYIGVDAYTLTLIQAMSSFAGTTLFMTLEGMPLDLLNLYSFVSSTSSLSICMSFYACFLYRRALVLKVIHRLIGSEMCKPV